MGKIMKKRDRLEVIYDILKIICDHHNSIKPTPLLRLSNISSNSFYEYYNELLAKEFIKEMSGADNKKYVTLTDKGFRYLEKYEKIQGFISALEL